MELNREEMIDILSRVLPGLAKKIAAQQSTSFVFRQGRIITYNDEICVSVKADWGFEGAVQADPLYKLLNRLKGDTVLTEVKEGQLRITCGRSRSGIKMDAEIVLPLEEITMPTEDTVTVEIPKGFAEAVQMCLFTAGRNRTKPIMTCINIDNDIIQSCDNHRITKITVPGMKIAAINIPADYMRALLAYNPTTLLVTEAWAHFLNEKGTAFSCRLVEGEYPDLMSVITEVEGPELRMPKGMEEILGRAGVFTEKEVNIDGHVKIKTSGGKMTVKGEGPAGWFEETVRVRLKKDCEFIINPEFLEKILSINAVAVVGDSALLFRAENFIHAIALMAV